MVWHNVISRSNTISSLISFLYFFFFVLFWFFFSLWEIYWEKKLVTENHYQLNVHKHAVKLYFKSGNIVTRLILLQLCFHSKDLNRPEQFWITFALFADVLEFNTLQNINKPSLWPIMKNDLFPSLSFSVILFLRNIFIFLSIHRRFSVIPVVS